MNRRELFRRLLQGSAATALLSLAGCQFFKPPQMEIVDTDYLTGFDTDSFFLSPLFFERPPRRIVTLWAVGGATSDQLQAQFAEQLTNQFRQSRIAEMVLDKRMSGCHCDLNAILHGTFNEYDMLEVTTDYQADSLMLTRVNAFDAVWPMSMSATAVLIDRNDAIVTVAADGHWNLRVPELGRAYQSYNKHFSSDLNQRLVEANLRSPLQFQSFVAWQIASVVAEHKQQYCG
ncbi:MAG: hypothetical protein R3C03_15030 [Pirellulaceae bacterium]